MKSVEQPRSAIQAPPRHAAVAHLPIFTSDAAVVAAIRAGQGAGGAAMYDRHHEYVRRVLIRILGPDTDLGDLMQDVFVIAIDSIASLEHPDALRSWLAGISVQRAKTEIRRRVRGRWFPLFPRGDLPEVEAPLSTPEINEALRSSYRVLEKLPADERVAFVLRFVEGMELVEVATACQVSVSTAKRRLVSARKRFETMARTYPELAEFLCQQEGP
jgi:RNA polymerase sigma-70 factor (ECF subfamily)